MISKITFVLLLFSSLNFYAQTLIGRVLDAKTKAPLETVSVYFDNTTIGTTTNDSGEFTITYNDAVKSTLVISYLGYEKVFVSDYRAKDTINILLTESVAELETVVLSADDGMSRAEKMRYFKREFLGQSDNGKSCKILNEEVIHLRYNKKERTISAYSKQPIIIVNKNLKYEINFDLTDFEILLGNWNVSKVTYSGTSFYKDLNSKNKSRISTSRCQSYNGSVQHFMRALYNKNFKDQGYIFGKKGFKVNPYDYFSVSNADKSGIKSVRLLEKIDVFFNGVTESVIQSNVSTFTVDQYGNYAPITEVLFGGNMGQQRIGDMLPLDFGFKTN